MISSLFLFIDVLVSIETLSIIVVLGIIGPHLRISSTRRLVLPSPRTYNSNQHGLSPMEKQAQGSGVRKRAPNAYEI